MVKQISKNLNPHKASVETYAVPVLFMLAAAVLVLTPEFSYANAIANTVCTIVHQLAGPVGRAIAAVAVIFLGFSLFMGKVTWGLALALGIGIAAIFGAPEIVSLLGGGSDACQ